jgi:hypothetical protein
MKDLVRSFGLVSLLCGRACSFGIQDFCNLCVFFQSPIFFTENCDKEKKLTIL